MIKKIGLLFLLVFVIISCSDDEPVTMGPDNDNLKTIMPLGASRVQGARPNFESYRYELWKLLLDGNFSFDYIGTRDDDASYPDYKGESFDMDHEGRGGWTSGQILGGINEWLSEAGTPDIVLFSSPGGNDALQNLPYDNAIENVNAIIDIIQDINPNATIVIEKLAPARSDLMTGALAEYFDKMQEDVEIIAAEQSTTTSAVITVDMVNGFVDEYLADPVHYNEEGAKFIADRYFEILSDILQN